VIKGRLKVTHVEGFFGVFKDSKGQIFDLRNPDDIISFDYLMGVEIRTLAFIFDSALTGQINCLKRVEDFDINLYKQLKKFKKKFIKKYKNILKIN
jgi:hypothetical protein